MGHGGAGHVAYVDVVTPTYIEISEDAYLTSTTGYSSRRRLDRSGTTFATAEFIHVKDQIASESAGDLWFVKTKNVGSGRVEVHSATAASGYTSGLSTTLQSR